jgi:hypothetical protein
MSKKRSKKKRSKKVGGIFAKKRPSLVKLVEASRKAYQHGASHKEVEMAVTRGMVRSGHLANPYKP